MVYRWYIYSSWAPISNWACSMSQKWGFVSLHIQICVGYYIILSPIIVGWCFIGTFTNPCLNGWKWWGEKKLVTCPGKFGRSPLSKLRVFSATEGLHFSQPGIYDKNWHAMGEINHLQPWMGSLFLFMSFIVFDGCLLKKIKMEKKSESEKYCFW